MRRVLFFILSLPLLALGCKSQAPANENANRTTNRTVVTNTPVVNTNTNVPVPSTPSAETALQRIAVTFAERYGSFSNQSDFANLESVLPYMTAAFQDRTRLFISSERAKKRDTSIYYALTTRSSRVTTETFNENGPTAMFLVLASRSEAIGSPVNVQHYEETFRVTMSKEGGVWRVDNATWENKKS